MTTPCGMTPRSIKSTDGMFGQGCAKPGCVSSNAWTGPSLCSSRGATCACAVARRHCADWHRPKRRRPSPRAQPANPKKRALGWRTSRSGPPACAVVRARRLRVAVRTERHAGAVGRLLTHAAVRPGMSGYAPALDPTGDAGHFTDPRQVRLVARRSLPRGRGGAALRLAAVDPPGEVRAERWSDPKVDGLLGLLASSFNTTENPVALGALGQYNNSHREEDYGRLPRASPSSSE